MSILLMIDPGLVEVPNHAANQGEAEAIVNRITYWSDPLLYHNLFRMVMLEDALATLSDLNYFPTGPNIEALLDMWGLRSIYTAQDVRKSINFILTRAITAHDALSLEVTEASLHACVPDLNRLATERELLNATLRSAVASILATVVSTQIYPIVVSGFARRGGPQGNGDARFSSGNQ